jgi:hypothetical protein
MAFPTTGNGPSAADTVQRGLLRAAGLTGRFAAAQALTVNVVSLSRRAIRKRHPSWSEADVLLEFVRLHYGRELADAVRSHLERRSR